MTHDSVVTYCPLTSCHHLFRFISNMSYNLLFKVHANFNFYEIVSKCFYLLILSVNVFLVQFLLFCETLC